MSSSPTYYKELNRHKLPGGLTWLLSLGFVGTLLYRRGKSPSMFSEAVFALSLLAIEFVFYVHLNL